jgi:hypothetical protein
MILVSRQLSEQATDGNLSKLLERFLVYVHHCFERGVIQGYLPLIRVILTTILAARSHLAPFLINQARSPEKICAARKETGRK